MCVDVEALKRALDGGRIFTVVGAPEIKKASDLDDLTREQVVLDVRVTEKTILRRKNVRNR